jgi:hypothetical protein
MFFKDFSSRSVKLAEKNIKEKRLVFPAFFYDCPSLDSRFLWQYVRNSFAANYDSHLPECVALVIIDVIGVHLIFYLLFSDTGHR